MGPSLPRTFFFLVAIVALPSLEAYGAGVTPIIEALQKGEVTRGTLASAKAHILSHEEGPYACQNICKGTSVIEGEDCVGLWETRCSLAWPGINGTIYESLVYQCHGSYKTVTGTRVMLLVECHGAITYDSVLSMYPIADQESNSLDSPYEEPEINSLVRVLYYCGNHSTYDMNAKNTEHKSEGTFCEGLESTTAVLLGTNGPLKVSEMEDFLEEDSSLDDPQSGIWSSILANIPTDDTVLLGLDQKDSKYANIAAECNGEPSEVHVVCKGNFTYSGTEGSKDERGSCDGTYSAQPMFYICKGTSEYASSEEGPHGTEKVNTKCIGSEGFAPLVLDVKGQESVGFTGSCTGTGTYRGQWLLSDSKLIVTDSVYGVAK